MKSKFSKGTVAAAASLGFCVAQAQTAPEFALSGYGTVGVVHTNERNADFVGDRFQPKGAGHSKSWSLNPDTRLGLQGNVKFGQQWSGVVQVVAKQQNDNTWTPKIEWANLKWQPTRDLDLRLGRIAAPSYLLSESRFVGYASTYLRVPSEVYGVIPVTSNDGMDATWRTQFEGANNTAQFYVGKSTARLGEGTIKAHRNWGFNDSLEIGSLQLRAGYNAVKLDLQYGGFDALLGGLQQFAAGAGAVPLPAFQSATTQALALAGIIDTRNLKLSAVALGFSYDPGPWLMTGEYVKFKGESVLSDSRSWYLMGGVRLGSFTPYLTFASTRADVSYGTPIDTSGAPPLTESAAMLSGGVIGVQQSMDADQDTSSLGVRWDFAKNVAAKLQFDRINLKGNSVGRLKTFSGVAFTSRTVNLVSMAVDFVF